MGDNILQGEINRDEYYSIKQAAKVLGVTDKTIRNRIEANTIHAVWYEAGAGKSQWLIPVASLLASRDDSIEGGILPASSLSSALIEEIKAQIRADNEAIRAENAQIKAELEAVRQSQERIEKSLQERDVKLLQAIRERQEERREEQQKQASKWWEFWK